MKFLFSILLVMISLNANAATLEACKIISPNEIASEFITAFKLGAMGSYGSPACLEASKQLNIQPIFEQYESVNFVTLNKKDAVKIINVYEDDGRFVAIYEIKLSDGRRLPGEFSFYKNENFLDPKAVETFKCASLAEEASVPFIDHRCLK